MRTIVYIAAILLITTSAYSQNGRKEIRMGNKLYDKVNYVDSEVKYKKALEKNPNSLDAKFNLGDALYKQGRYDDATKVFMDLAKGNPTKDQQNKIANSFFNLGNSFLKENKVKESIEAYENSLRLNPSDMDAKYNLEYAKMLLKKNNQKSKDQSKNDKNSKDKDKKDQDKNKDNKQDQQDKKQQNKDNSNQKNQQPKISKDDADRILNALQNSEDQVQQKINDKKVEATKVKVQKNW
jgi:Tfp pilus assembly protein PilF